MNTVIINQNKETQEIEVETLEALKIKNELSIISITETEKIKTVIANVSSGVLEILNGDDNREQALKILNIK